MNNKRQIIGLIIVTLLVGFGLLNLLMNFQSVKTDKLVTNDNSNLNKIAMMGVITKSGDFKKITADQFSTTDQIVLWLQDLSLPLIGKIQMSGPGGFKVNFDVNLEKAKNENGAKIYLPRLSRAGKYVISLSRGYKEKYVGEFTVKKQSEDLSDY